MTAYRRWQSTSYRKTRSAANYLCLLIAVKRRRIRYLLLMASFFGRVEMWRGGNKLAITNHYSVSTPRS